MKIENIAFRLRLEWADEIATPFTAQAEAVQPEAPVEAEARTEAALDAVEEEKANT